MQYNVNTKNPKIWLSHNILTTVKCTGFVKEEGMKVNVDKSKMMVVSEENTQCQIMFIGK